MQQLSVSICQEYRHQSDSEVSHFTPFTEPQSGTGLCQGWKNLGILETVFKFLGF